MCVLSVSVCDECECMLFGVVCVFGVCVVCVYRYMWLCVWCDCEFIWCVCLYGSVCG